jgi:hypothetical protein
LPSLTTASYQPRLPLVIRFLCNCQRVGYGWQCGRAATRSSGSGVGLVLGLLAAKVLAFIVYQATPRDLLVLAGVVLTMLLLGLVATWVPAQRALSVNPLILLREE